MKGDVTARARGQARCRSRRRAAMAATANPAASAGPDRRRDAPRLPGRCPDPRGLGAGREGPARLGRAPRPARGRPPEPRRRPAPHPGRHLAPRPLTCPSRQQLGSFLLDALDPELAAYLTFHLDVVECPFCQANLDDLKAQSQAATAAQASKTRQHRILQSSQHLLGEEKR